MKKIFLSLISVLIFVSPNFAFAQDSTATPTPLPTRGSNVRDHIKARISVAVDERVSNLKQRADSEIARRVTALNGLISRISQIKKLTNTQKADFTSKIQAQIDALNALKTKIDTDTDLTTLKTDVKSIVDSYRIFLVFMPQIRLLGAADRLSTVASDLTALSAKLETRISDAKSLGKDTVQLDTYLTDLNSKVAEAQTESSAVINEILPLTPDGYPGNRSIVLDARAKIKTGTNDVKTARQDALNIVKQLKLWGSITVTPTSTP